MYAIRLFLHRTARRCGVALFVRRAGGASTLGARILARRHSGVLLHFAASGTLIHVLGALLVGPLSEQPLPWLG